MSALLVADLAVLVVDDQRPFQVMLKGILASLGLLQVQFASSGEQAMNRCSKTEFDLLFVDYNLGAGKNGRQLLQDLRERQLLKPNSIFIIVTGENTVTMVMSAVELEPDDYLIKPFSQSLLKNRLLKLQQKKQELSELYEALYLQDNEKIILCCQQHIQQHGRYEQFCRRVLAERWLLLREDQSLETLLTSSLAQRRPSWALLLFARFRLLQQNYQHCQQLCQEVIDTNRLCAQAFDILSQCLLAQELKEEAFSSVQQALAIAPFHLPRQFLLMDVAREAGKVAEMVQASKQIFELTRRTNQQDVTHLLNYIRTLLDAIEQTDDAGKRNRLQQETMLALHRHQKDEQLMKNVDFVRFEQICLARIEAIDGRYQQIKKMLSPFQQDITPADAEAADLIMLLFRIGEFEEAESLLAQLPTPEKPDPVLCPLLEQQKEKYQQVSNQLTDLNKSGIQLYQEGKYQEAITIFEQAMHLAPTNSGATLNLIQALLQVLNTQQKNKSLTLYQRCRQLFKTIEPSILSEQHQQRYADLQQQYQLIRLELKQSS
jgi:DNA-binding response OmpR family regulator/tetratricopeptide (TPR) repeat protein